MTLTTSQIREIVEVYREMYGDEVILKALTTIQICCRAIYQSQEPEIASMILSEILNRRQGGKKCLLN